MCYLSFSLCHSCRFQDTQSETIGIEHSRLTRSEYLAAMEGLIPRLPVVIAIFLWDWDMRCTICTASARLFFFKEDFPGAGWQMMRSMKMEMRSKDRCWGRGHRYYKQYVKVIIHLSHSLSYKFELQTSSKVRHRLFLAYFYYQLSAIRTSRRAKLLCDRAG